MQHQTYNTYTSRGSYLTNVIYQRLRYISVERTILFVIQFFFQLCVELADLTYLMKTSHTVS